MIYVLDTNTLSFLIDNDQQVITKFADVINTGGTFLGCPLVWFEIQRGLLAKDARARMRRFDLLWTDFAWDDYQRSDWALAAQWWALRRSVGMPVSDADLLIAVFAYQRDAILVTDNEKDFVGLPVRLENWKSP